MEIENFDRAQERLLTPEALLFLTQLHQQFDPRRQALLLKRQQKQEALNAGLVPGFLQETASIRRDPLWTVASCPPDLAKRYVEITGPVERKMMINALNSGANVFMADFEDALTPTWSNVILGHNNLIDAVNRTLSFISPEGKAYALNPEIATLMVRPRGWHLEEKHLPINEVPISASLFDFGLYFFHNAKNCLKQGSGPYFYLPKLENHEEARLWNDVFLFAQKTLQIPPGSIRATVLIETILAAFEAEEILYELREHSAGLNAGRWDYIFSIIKKFQNQHDFLFPDRGQITMQVPFMQAYTRLLVEICHKRGAHAIGGMAAFIPNRKKPDVTQTALAKVTEDKLLECQIGFDGTWVAHPDLVSLAKNIFKGFLKDQPNQISLKKNFSITSDSLLDFKIPGGKITEAGVRQNIQISLLYLASWLRGVGAAALFDLMEDTATAEISRAQLWQWLHHQGKLADGRQITPGLLRTFFAEEFEKIRAENQLDIAVLNRARCLVESLVLDKHFTDFLTLIAYEQLN
ncbi:MAG: malate synthase A [Parachlamydia sp.]|nr:MAG: malate synthase A [Parachlamydia sp.]